MTSRRCDGGRCDIQFLGEPRIGDFAEWLAIPVYARGNRARGDVPLLTLETNSPGASADPLCDGGVRQRTQRNVVPVEFPTLEERRVPPFLRDLCTWRRTTRRPLFPGGRWDLASFPSAPNRRDRNLQPLSKLEVRHFSERQRVPVDRVFLGLYVSEPKSFGFDAENRMGAHLEYGEQATQAFALHRRCFPVFDAMDKRRRNPCFEGEPALCPSQALAQRCQSLGERWWEGDHGRCGRPSKFHVWRFALRDPPKAEHLHHGVESVPVERAFGDFLGDFHERTGHTSLRAQLTTGKPETIPGSPKSACQRYGMRHALWKRTRWIHHRPRRTRLRRRSFRPRNYDHRPKRNPLRSCHRHHLHRWGCRK